MTMATTHMGREAMTAGDIRYLDGVIQRTMAVYATEGAQEPVAFVERDDGKMAVLQSAGLANEQEKTAFLNVVRHHSLRSGSRRSAIVGAGWAIVDQDDEAMAEVAAHMQRGGRVSEHPLAKEMVTIFLESEAGATLQMLSVTRASPTTAILEPVGDARFLPWSETVTNWGTFSAFHVRSAMRLRPDVLNWAADMDRQMAGLIQAEPTPGFAPPTDN